MLCKDDVWRLVLYSWDAVGNLHELTHAHKTIVWVSMQISITVSIITSHKAIPIIILRFTVSHHRPHASAEILNNRLIHSIIIVHVGVAYTNIKQLQNK